MMPLSWFTRRVRALVRRRAVELEMNDELRFHLDAMVAARVREGLRPDDARREAMLHFGGMEQVKERYRDARGVRHLDELGQDIRYGLRALRKAPGFTLVVLLTLTLGIGANTAVFSVVRGVLLRELPYGDASRLVMVWETDRNSGTDNEAASVPDYFDFLARSRSFDAIAGFAPNVANYIMPDGRPARVNIAEVTGAFLPTLGVSPVEGRSFVAAEDQRGGPRAVVVSERFVRTHMAVEGSPLGKVIRLDDSSFTIVGVVSSRMQFPTADTDLWVPFQLTPESGPRSRHFVNVVARMRPGVSAERAQREMGAVAAALEHENPNSNQARGVRIQPLEDALLGPVRQALVVLLGAVGLVLLIACVNVANLLLARLAARDREVAVRSALGATATRLAQQFVVEGLLLTMGASVLALMLAPTTLRVLVRLAPVSLPRLDEVRLDPVVLAVTLGVSVAVALAFGVLPALGARRWGLAQTLRVGQKGGASSRQHQPLRSALVTSEVALALVLVIGAALLMQSFWRLRRVDPGWRSTNLLRVQLQLPASRYPQSYSNFPAGWSRILDFERELVRRVTALPGVRNAALASNDPLALGFTNSFVIEGREAEAAAGQAELATRPVSAGYFATAGIPVLRGRGFEAGDDAKSPPVLLINDAAAKKYFANQSPVGRRLRFWGTWRTIIGVVGNERFAGLASEPPPAMYPPLSQTPMATVSLLVRTESEPSTLASAVNGVVWSLDRDIAPYGVTTMSDALDASVSQQRFMMQLLGLFAALALGLSLLGVYGVVSYGVAQRTHEIGVRMALGATRGEVVQYVLRQGARLSLVGAAVGVVVALGAVRLLSSQLYGVRPTDVPTFAGAVLGILAAAVLGSWLPALRASRVHPVVALRAE